MTPLTLFNRPHPPARPTSTILRALIQGPVLLAGGLIGVRMYQGRDLMQFCWLTLAIGGVLHLSVLPWIGIRRWCRYQRALSRRLRNECEQCGYSLEGNVSGRCPECSHPVPED